MKVESPASSSDRPCGKLSKKTALSKKAATQRHRMRKSQQMPDFDGSVEALGKEVQDMIPQLQELRRKYNQLLIQNMYLKQGQRAPSPVLIHAPAAFDSDSPPRVSTQHAPAPSSSGSGRTAQEEFIIDLPPELDFSDLLDEVADEALLRGPVPLHGPFANQSVHRKVQAAFTLNQPGSPHLASNLGSGVTRIAGAMQSTHISGYSQLQSVQGCKANSNSAPLPPVNQPSNIKHESSASPLGTAMLPMSRPRMTPCASMSQPLKSPLISGSGQANLYHSSSMPAHVTGLGNGLPMHGQADHGSHSHCHVDTELLEDYDEDEMHYLAQVVLGPSDNAAGPQHAHRTSPDSTQDQAVHEVPLMSTTPRQTAMQSAPVQQVEWNQHLGIMLQPEPNQDFHNTQTFPNSSLVDAWATGTYGACRQDGSSPEQYMYADVCFMDADTL